MERTALRKSTLKKFSAARFRSRCCANTSDGESGIQNASNASNVLNASGTKLKTFGRAFAASRQPKIFRFS